MLQKRVAQVLLLAVALAALVPLPAARANELYAAVGLGGKAGEPDFSDKRPTLTLGFEAERTWRFSLTSGDYEHDNNAAVELETRIFGIERIWYYNLSKDVALLGAFGPGLFQARVSNGASESSGSAFGILATGNLRVYLSQGFVDLGYHYRNAAVIINQSSFNGGYEAVALGAGLRF